MGLWFELRTKWYRWRLPDGLRHQRRLHPGFRMVPIAGQSGAWVIQWEGRDVGRTLPYAALRNRASGPCYIIATGPSLAEVDFSRLAGQKLFGVAGAIAKREAGVEFNYYMHTDQGFMKKRFPMIRSAIESGAICCFSFHGFEIIAATAPELLKSPNLVLVDIPNGGYDRPALSPAQFDAEASGDPDYAIHPTDRLKEGLVGWSRNLEKGVFSANTVTYSALQVARYLGHSPLFILGMDLGFSGEKSRFYETAKDGIRSQLGDDYAPYILPAFEVAGGLCRSGELEIYNLSPTSRLPGTVIPKISLEQALELGRG